MLLHSAVLVRHNAVMLGNHLERVDLISALASICHGSGLSEQATGVDMPVPPMPSDQQSDCPICTGMMSAVADLPQRLVIDAPECAVSRSIAHVAEIIAPSLRSVWPPSRAPPASV